MSDPNFASVVLLLHFDGTDGSTTFVDSGPGAKTVSVVNDAEIDTAQSKWGGASGLFTSTGGDAITVPHASDSDFTSSDWTIECWLRHTTLDGDQTYAIKAAGTPGLYTFWLVKNYGNKILIGCRDSGGGYPIEIIGTTTLTTGTWYHVAATRSGSTFRLFINGTLEVSGTYAGSIYHSASAPICVGGVEDGINYGMRGHIDDLRITNGLARYTASFTPPTEAYPGPSTPEGYIVVDSPLGAAEVLGEVSYFGHIEAASPLGAVAVLGHLLYGSIEVASPLGEVSALGLHDFTGLVEGLISVYVMDLVTPSGDVRVPISSWQATLQTTEQSYTQAVIPACSSWVADIEVATEFVIYRQATLADGSVFEHEMARAPVQTVALDRGSRNYTATISGYSDAFVAAEDPDTALDRTLDGIRTTSVNAGKMRVRCSIDWLLRPGQRAYVDATPIIADYINYYVPGFDQYMDVGESA